MSFVHRSHGPSLPGISLVAAQGEVLILAEVARERCVIKRELRRRGVAFHNEDSMEALAGLLRLARTIDQSERQMPPLVYRSILIRLEQVPGGYVAHTLGKAFGPLALPEAAEDAAMHFIDSRT
jgi:hypothetical protein